MGLEIDREVFAEDDFERFADKLKQCLDALRILVARRGFGVGSATIGAELELNLVDQDLRPALVNRSVLAQMVDERLCLEVDRFNLEINARPSPLAGRPFTAMAEELSGALRATREAARGHGARVVTIGILPTLRQQDLDSDVLTEGRRYRALSAGLRRARGEPFVLRIEGIESLDLDAHDVTYEGANTSFQVHLRTDPAAFAATYNAAQIATSVVLAASANSPLFLGRRLWDETRIALFRQSVDDRATAASEDWRPARVSFGHGWVRRGALELFEESVALHEPLLPVCGREDPVEVARLSGMPALDELKLHHGTVWRWNRAVYDAASGGHLRVELRSLPAGPTVPDMVANAAFLLGLTLALREDADGLVTRLTFGQARRNFYLAARHGLDAELLWPSERGLSPVPTPAARLAERCLPLARHALIREGVDAEEADRWLGILRERVSRRMTGARWQRAAFDRASSTANPDAIMLRRYMELSENGEPVHTWPEP